VRPELRVDRPHDVLALMPHRFGFRLHECVVLLGLRAPRHEIGLVARIDLRTVLAPAGPDALRRSAEHLVADGADEVVAVVYVDEDDPRDPDRGLRADPASAAARAAAAVRGACDAVRPADVWPVDVWVVARGRYLGLDCRDASCCPPGGRAVRELDAATVAGLVARRGPVLESREEVGKIAPADAAPRRSAAAARSRWADARLRCAGPVDLLAWRRRSLEAWRSTLAGGGAAPAALGRIEAALDDQVVRDAVLLTLVEPDSDLPEALLRHAGAAPTWADPDDPDDRDPDADADADADLGPDLGPGARAPGAPRRPVPRRVRAALRGLVDPDVAREPEVVLVDAGEALLEKLVAHGRSGRQAPALTLLAVLAWWGGDAVRAAVLVERALDDDPGHRLAELVDRALGAALPPAWLRRRC
jgi:hypothetical protein